MKIQRLLCLAMVTPLVLAACNGGGDNGGGNGPRLTKVITVPNISSGSNFSFDLGVVDSATGKYYFTDRNNQAVDVIDVNSQQVVAQIKGGFAGCNTGPTCNGANNDKSGPDGIDLITGTNFIFVGDVNAVKVIDKNTNTVTKTINVGGTSGLRADEGCYDPDDKIYMISSPGESPPFATFIDATTQTIIATLLFTDPGTGAAGPASAGLEACAYDHASNSFLVNNDGSTANPRGEVDVIPASAIRAGTPGAPITLTIPVITAGSGWKIFPLGICDPTGLVLGPGTDVAISCREGSPGDQLTVEILNRTNGAVMTILKVGGGDQIAYDSATNRYYLAASRWTASGKSSGPACTAASPCTPALIIIDASTYAVVANLFSGNNAHSVAVDPTTHQAFLPYSSAAAPAGCLDCSSVPLGGVLIFATQ
jgi:hypothetical protein